MCLNSKIKLLLTLREINVSVPHTLLAVLVVVLGQSGQLVSV